MCPEDIALTGCMLPACTPQMLYVHTTSRSLCRYSGYVWLSMQICRFHTCLWSLSSTYFPAIYIFYVYEGYLWNALVCNTWKCHGKNQNPITDFALNLGKGQNYTQQTKEPCETLCVCLFVCLFQETTKLQSFVVDISVIFSCYTVLFFTYSLPNLPCLCCQSWLCNIINDNRIDGEASMGFLPSNTDVKYCLERSPWRSTTFIFCTQNKIGQNWI